MKRPDPWARLSCPPEFGKISACRVGPELDREVFWTRDHLGQIGVQFSFKTTVPMPPSLPKLRGISIWTQDSPAAIRLTLADAKDMEIFHTLAEDLLVFTSSGGDDQKILSRLLLRLERWQRLLARERRGILSPREVRGLFGELFFLEQEVLPRLGPKAVRTWNGPDGAPQDFAVGLKVIEVKTRATEAPSKVTISSPAQLWPSLPGMHLVVYPIGHSTQSGSGRSLAGLVSDLRASLQGEFEMSFEDKLERAGYLDLPDYEEESYLLGPMESFEVRDGFPRITPGNIPDGVDEVTYSIDLDKCQQFRSPINWDQQGEE
jgi:hypothetical protein